jgi:pilus assembly protein Flp/PilA
MKNLMAFLKDEDGQGMVEYAVIIGVIAVVLIVVLIAFRGKIKEIFQGTTSGLDTATSND